jgi:hypothetical protein
MVLVVEDGPFLPILYIGLLLPLNLGILLIFSAPVADDVACLRTNDVHLI